jgi:WD40 repeat protein
VRDPGAQWHASCTLHARCISHPKPSSVPLPLLLPVSRQSWKATRPALSWGMGHSAVYKPSVPLPPCLHRACLQAILKGHNKAVTCLAMEHSGSRLISGSLDYTLRMYDMNGMKSDLRPFR